jgi:hypothetical protein
VTASIAPIRHQPGRPGRRWIALNRRRRRSRRATEPGDGHHPAGPHQAHRELAEREHAERELADGDDAARQLPDRDDTARALADRDHAAGTLAHRDEPLGELTGIEPTHVGILACDGAPPA